MIHYHGTPLGGTAIDASRFYKNRHAMVSFARQDDIAIVAETCQSFTLDNGAYAFWKSGGGAVDVRGYLSWLREWERHPAFDWALIPDVIDGTVDENDRLIAEWEFQDAKSVPVWHLNEPLGRLQMLAHRWPRVALGSSGEYHRPGSAAWETRMAVVMETICDEQGRPITKLHGLRMMSPAIINRFPFSSADSTNAVRNSFIARRFGMYPPPTRWQRATIIADIIEAVWSPPIWTREKQNELSLDLEEIKN